MFYYLLNPIMTYNLVLIATAIIPALLLLIRVYRADRLERESFKMLWKLLKAGILCSLLALVSERILSSILSASISYSSYLYKIILYFGIVAFSEEGSKYYALKKESWNSSEFNCMFDGVLYAVFVSMGLALWENVSYVMNYGFSTAVVRALTAIPGHASFGVFMGVFYAAAKSYDLQGNTERSRYFRILSVVVPALIHGAYDYIATMETTNNNILFIVFIIVLFAVSFKIIKDVSRNDRYL